MASIGGSCPPHSLYRNRTIQLRYDGVIALDAKQMSPNKKGQEQSKARTVVSSTIAATRTAPKRETDPKKRIVITGMGLASPLGNNVDTFYERLLNGESGISLINKFDASDYTVRIAGQICGFYAEGFSDRTDYQNLDESWRFSLFAAKTALQDANLTPEVIKSLDSSKIGVVVGSGSGGAATIYNAVSAALKQEYKRKNAYYPTNLGAALIAIENGFAGPTYSISTACATANYCLQAAANHIKAGEAHIMLAGATDAVVTPIVVSGFMACKALSSRNDEPQKASRPWDKGRDGFVMSEGSGVLVMESLEHANERGAKIIAEYLGGAITCDAHHLTEPRSDGVGAAACITKGLQNAGVSPEEVNYINAHATSTRIGDLAEINAIKKVFRNHSQVKTNATKSMIGHALGAAGALEAIATVKAITTGWLHPTINQYNLEPQVTIDTVPNVKIKHDVNVAISNSFGFGGHNSVVVFAPFTP